MTTQSSDLQTILERLEKLEKQNRRLKGIGLVTITAVSALVITAQAPSKRRTLQAASFEVIDATGKTLASLGSKGNEPALVLYGANGKELAGLHVAHFRAIPLGSRPVADKGKLGRKIRRSTDR